MISLAKGFAALVCALLIAGCGGGGGGGENEGGGGGNGGLGLTFEPSTLQAVVKSGDSANVQVAANASMTVAERLNVAVVDSQGVFTPSIILSAQSQLKYLAQLTVSNNLEPNTYRGTLTIKVCLDDAGTCRRPYAGSPYSLPYSIEVQPWNAPRVERKLLVSQVGVAFASVPGADTLTKNLRVTHNTDADVPWSATSNKSWLSVTGAGTTGGIGGSLTLSADASTLAANTVSYATVSIRSSDSTMLGDNVIVALWKGGAPAAQIFSPPDVVSYHNLVPDPIRPYVYASSLGDKIEAFNVYNGFKVATYHAPGASMREMAVAPDGGTLYAVDTKGSQIHVFDVSSGGAPRASWPLVRRAGISYPAIGYARPNGVGIVLVNDGSAFRASDGKLLSTSAGQGARTEFEDSYFGVAADGMKVFMTGSRKYTPNTPAFFRMDYTETGGGKLSLQTPVVATMPPGQDTRLQRAGPVSVEGNGARVFFANDRCTVWDGVNLKKISQFNTAAQNNGDLVLMSDGRVVCVRTPISNKEPGPVFVVYTGDGKFQRELPGSGSASETPMTVSSDANMLVYYERRTTSDSQASSLSFRPIGR